MVVLRLLKGQETDITYYKAVDISVVLRLMQDTLWEQSLTSSVTVKELRGSPVGACRISPVTDNLDKKLKYTVKNFRDFTP